MIMLVEYDEVNCKRGRGISVKCATTPEVKVRHPTESSSRSKFQEVVIANLDIRIYLRPVMVIDWCKVMEKVDLVGDWYR